MPVIIQYPAAGVRDHGLLTGLGDDDHGQYLMLTPPNGARNVISVPTATVKGLTLKTTDDSAVLPLLDLQTSAGVSVVSAKAAVNGTSVLDNFLNITGTLASAAVGSYQSGVYISIGSMGSASHTQRAVTIDLAAGYTGSTSNTLGLYVSNNAASTISTNLLTGNIGIQSIVSGTTTGNNFGMLVGMSGSSTLNAGISVTNITTNSTNANIGYIARVLNAGSGVQIGGIFALVSGTPTFESAAILADNGTTASNIATFRDNGTKVFEVRDGGQVYLSNGTLSGGSASEYFFGVTNTLPATLTASANAVEIDITGAGSSSQIIRAMNVQLLAGYTGGSVATGIRVNNSSGSTQATLTGGNLGIISLAQGTTATGYNQAIVGVASGSSVLNIGVFGRSATDTAGANVGILGQATNTSGVRVAGHFSLSTTAPTWTSAGIVVDNGSTTSPIIVAQDNGVTVFSIADGGAAAITLTNSASVGLTVTGAASQSGNYLLIQNSSSTALVNIDSSGNVIMANATVLRMKTLDGVARDILTYTVGNELHFGTSTGSTMKIKTNNAERISILAGGQIIVNNDGSAGISTVLFAVAGSSGHTGNLQEWRTTSTVNSTVSENGYFTTRKNSAPADAELAAGEVAYWFDSTNGASKFKIKGKSADGTVVTGEVALA